MANNKQSSVLDDIVPSERKDETDLSKTIDILLNEKYKRRKTILNNRQVSKITTIDVLGQIYDISYIKMWINNYGEWRTSGDGGKGRQDIVEIAKFSYMQREQERKELLDMIRNK